MTRKRQENEDDQQKEAEVSYPQYVSMAHWSDDCNKPALRAARDLYLKEYPYERIFLLTALPPSVFMSRRRSWDKVKARVDEGIITKIRRKAVSEQTKEFVEKGLQVGLKFVNRLLKREDEITPKDWKLVSDSIMALHRIHQLELGKPTDISVYEKMGEKEAKEDLLEMQKQLADKHEMTMFSPKEDVPEEEMLREYLDGADREVH